MRKPPDNEKLPPGGVRREPDETFDREARGSVNEDRVDLQVAGVRIVVHAPGARVTVRREGGVS